MQGQAFMKTPLYFSCVHIGLGFLILGWLFVCFWFDSEVTAERRTSTMLKLSPSSEHSNRTTEDGNEVATTLYPFAAVVQTFVFLLTHWEANPHCRSTDEGTPEKNQPLRSFFRPPCPEEHRWHRYLSSPESRLVLRDADMSF